MKIALKEVAQQGDFFPERELSMWQAADYRLADVLGVAGATIGIMIAAGILLQFLSTRYIAIFERYRGLTGEYRGNHASDARRDSLKNQIAAYGRQIALLNWATQAVTVALLSFVATVIVASLSVIFPQEMGLRAAGTIGLFLGLGLIAFGVALVQVEAMLQRHTLAKETSDFNDLPSVHDALRS